MKTKRSLFVLLSWLLPTVAVWELGGWVWAMLTLGALLWVDAYVDTWIRSRA